MFLGRERELEALREAFEDDRSGLVPVYGRRRMGKSTLVRELLGDRPGVHFAGQEAPAELQQRRLLRAAATALERPVLAELQVGSWRTVLARIVEQAGGKVVLALDDFDRTAAASPELPSVLQELWDTVWSRENSVLLVLASSSLGFMEREVLGHDAPLFGRRTAQIRLAPLGLGEARAFHPGWTLAEVARARFAVGGVPAYLAALAPERTVAQSLVAELFTEGGRMREEPDLLLRQELRETASYGALLGELARGPARPKDLAAATGLSERNLPYYLAQLVGLGYVEKRYPLVEGPPSPRRVRYVLADPLLAFWYRFVWPNESALAQRGPERTFAEEVGPRLPAYFEACFEAVCREALPALYDAEGVEGGWQVGEYWDREVRLGLVGVREDGRTDLGATCWVERPDAAHDLALRAARYPNERGARVGLRIFGRRAGPAGGATRHTLEDLYGE